MPCDVVRQLLLLGKKDEYVTREIVGVVSCVEESLLLLELFRQLMDMSLDD
jgi:hypothetical protein